MYACINSNRRGRPPKQGLPFDDYNDDEPEHGKKYRLDDKDTNSDTTQEDGNGKQSSFSNYCCFSAILMYNLVVN